MQLTDPTVCLHQPPISPARSQPEWAAWLFLGRLHSPSSSPQQQEQQELAQRQAGCWQRSEQSSEGGNRHMKMFESEAIWWLLFREISYLISDNNTHHSTWRLVFLWVTMYEWTVNHTGHTEMSQKKNAKQEDIRWAASVSEGAWFDTNRHRSIPFF